MSSSEPVIGPSAAEWGPSPVERTSIDVPLEFGAFPYGGLPPPSRLEGWPFLAELMVEIPDLESFARFKSLNVKNLLYYQVELAELELSLRKREMADMDPAMDNPNDAYSRSKIHQRPEIMMGEMSPQWDTVMRVRQLLHEYNQALLEYAQVSALSEPSTHNMRELVALMYDESLGGGKVRGVAADKWGPYLPRDRRISLRRFLGLLLRFFRPSPKGPHASDLIAPRGGKPLGRPARWISEEVLPFQWDFGEFWSRRHKMTDEEKNEREGNVDEMSRRQAEKDTPKDERLLRVSVKRTKTCQEAANLSLRVTAAICTLLASMLPMAAIFLLAIVNELWHRLFMLASFAFIFATLLVLLTEATRVQIFTTTAAFLAVLVVFIPTGGS